MTHGECPCPQSFRLHTFPSKLRFGEIRDGWTRALNRVTKRKTPWQPGPSDTVCSRHFLEGVPTALNPLPTFELGYEKPAKKSRRELIRIVPEADYAAGIEHNSTFSQDEPEKGSIEGKRQSCADNDVLSSGLRDDLNKAREENLALDESVCALTKEMTRLRVKHSTREGFSIQNIKHDSDMTFYTGLSMKVFDCLCKLLEPYVPNFIYWRGRKVLCAKPKGQRRQRK